MRHRPIDAALLLLLLLLPGLAAALESDHLQPIHLQADHVVLDNRHGTSNYRGHVVFEQGSLHLEADSLTAYRSGTTLDRVEATGSPVRFRQRVGKKGTEVRGQAQHIEYRAETGHIVLQGAAQVQHGSDHMSGERIEYNVRRGVVTASGGGDHRVHATIRPKQAPTAGDKAP